MDTSLFFDKGRAIAARPLSCLVGLAALLLLGVAGSAQAAIPAPTLTGTDPASPGASTTPRIQGMVSEGEAQVISFGATTSALRPITQANEPNNTVLVYTAANCTGQVIGEGTVALLEAEGILVKWPVATDATTTFYATQSNEAETSECSQGLSYRQMTSPLTAPVFTGVDPAPPANSNFPRLKGLSDPETTVSIYANASCGGAEAGSGGAALFGSQGIQVLVADNSETTFSARATLGSLSSPCSSSPLVYREETPKPNPDPGGGGGGGAGGGGANGGGSTPATPPPAPRLRMLPSRSANDNDPLVSGTAPDARSVQIYASANCDSTPVAKGAPAELAAGIPVRVVDNAVVVFTAVSVSGEKTSKCSDPVRYTEDSLTPRTRITMGPAAKTAKRKAVIRFTDTTGDAAGTSFLCKVDRKRWKPCSSPLRLKKLKPKRYTVRVKASDPAGNVEIKGAKRSFKVIRR